MFIQCALPEFAQRFCVKKRRMIISKQRIYFKKNTQKKKQTKKKGKRNQNIKHFVKDSNKSIYN